MRNWIILIMKPAILVGGQAVIEGVMMRVPGAYATAVRDPKGNVHIDRHKFTSVTEHSAFWKKPVFRGMAALFEAMKMGMATLQWSADIAIPDESEKNKNNRVSDFFSTILAVGLAILLFAPRKERIAIQCCCWCYTYSIFCSLSSFNFFDERC